MRPRRRPGWALLALVLVTALAGCSDDPSGRGTLTLTVEGGTTLGAAVLELRGDGVLGVEPLAAGWAHLEQVAGGGSQTPVYRLVLVQEQAGTLSARVEVEDVAAPFPVVTVLLASDGDDLPLASVTGVQARLRR